MREMLACENCKKIWVGDKKTNKYCSDCYGVLRPLNISDSLWDRMSDVEKQEILNNNENKPTTKIELEILSGIYIGKELFFDIKKEVFDINLGNEYNINNEVVTSKVTKNFDEVMYYSNYEIERDNSKFVSIVVGVVTWFGSGFYNYYRTFEIFAFIDSIVTGIIWGFVAWIISKQFKEKMSATKIKFSDFEINIKYNQDMVTFLDNKFKSKNNSKYSFSNNDMYEQLIKLKDLLDRGIITDEEFKEEKKKILNS